MEAAVKAMREAGYEQATLWVLEGNGRARRFYGAAGWIADGASQIDDHDGLGLREVRYRFRLT